MSGGPRALQITDSHISRLRKGTGSLSVEVMLRLADLLDEDGVAVLRTCGHVRIADLFERLQRGEQQRPRHVLYDAIDRLSEDDRAIVSLTSVCSSLMGPSYFWLKAVSSTSAIPSIKRLRISVISASRRRSSTSSARAFAQLA